MRLYDWLIYRTALRGRAFTVDLKEATTYLMISPHLKNRHGQDTYLIGRLKKYFRKKINYFLNSYHEIIELYEFIDKL
jgi:hypothetical protein